MKHKARTKALSWLLSLALALSLVPGVSIPAYAATLTNSSTTWSEDSTIESNVTITANVYVTTDMTLTIPAGKTLTVNGTINTNGHTLTVAGAGELIVHGKNGADGAGGEDELTCEPWHNDSTPGDTAINGSLIVDGATVTATGGNGGNGDAVFEEFYPGSNGGHGIAGNVTVKSGSVTATGGSGGNGATSSENEFNFATGGNGGNGVTGTVTLTGGSITGNGGSGGAHGYGGAAFGQTPTAGAGYALSQSGNTYTIVTTATVGETEYLKFSDAMTAWYNAEDGKTLTLLANVEPASTIVVTGTKTLDLNGHELKMTGETGSVIQIDSGATLTLDDSSEDKTGTITGGNAQNGGGVSNYGTFNMTDGTITGNTATQFGGGVCNMGTFTMTGGTITGNTATTSGGGVCNYGGTFRISGSPVITGNTGSDVTAYDGKPITVTGALDSTASIGVTLLDGDENLTTGVFTSGLSGKGSLSNFTNGNGTGYALKLTESGEAEMVRSYSVIVTPGENMTKTEDSGAASQTGLTGAMTAVVYTANDGYYFPTDYSVASVNGISVARDSYTQITVSGTPTANAEITLTAPTQKTTPDAPATAAALNCTTADNNDGKITGVTTAMEYKKSDAENWTVGTGSDIENLGPGTYYVRVKATDTANASANQELTIADYNTAAANTVSGTISALPAAADVTLDNAQAVADAKAAYDALTNDQKALVPADTVNKLNAAVAKIADLTAANTVSGTISALPAAADVTLDNAQAVADAKAAYDALTDDQKALVPADTVNKLNAAVAKIADLTAANTVSGTISALPAAADVTLDNAQAIADAKAAYDALTDDQKALVPADTVNKLNAAVAKIADLTAANTVSGTISALPAAADVTLDNAQAVADAKAAYDALTADQKALVPAETVSNLNAAVAKIADLTAANTASGTISALPDFSNVTTANKDAIEAARTAYNALTNDQKALVSADTLKKLTDAEDKLVIIQAMSEVSAKTGSGMTYTGSPIQLINTPTTALPEGYTMKYAVTTENVAPTDDNLYTTSIPTATNAGTYYVWYKVVGDENHNDTEAVCVTASIQRRSSSSGGSTTTTVTVPVTSDTTSGSVAVNASVSGTTATVTKLTDAQLAQVTDNNAAIGTETETNAVSIDVSGVAKDVKTAVIPTESVKAVEETGSSLQVTLTDGSVEFDTAAQAAITDAAKGSDIRLNLDAVSESSLNSAQQTAVKEMEVQIVVDAYITSNGERISDFKGGSATLSIPYTLKDGQTANGIVVWYVAADGTRTQVPARYDGKNVVFTVTHFSNYVVAYDAEQAKICPKDSTCPISAFTDAKPTAWYHDGVHWAIENGVMNGVGNGKFEPNDTTTRAQVVTMLWRLEGSPAYVGMSEFSDVDNEEWYGPAVRWANAEGIVNGYDDGRFGPNDAVTREQLVAILYRYAQYKKMDVSVGEDTNILSYDDAFDVSSWAMSAMQWAVGSGVVNGVNKGGTLMLAPLDASSRAVVATMLWRFCK